MMNVLVTGGCGFIGSNFVRYLLESAPDVHVINLKEDFQADKKLVRL